MHKLFDYSQGEKHYTAAKILEAFRRCDNSGEEIELFDYLAKRSENPIPAFVDILEQIKLEPVLALTIQAFGKITNANLRERLQQSDDLLAKLSKKAESGETDLIRWSAATTIEKLEFDFINVARHLSEEPQNSAKRIVESRLKILTEKQRLEERNDYSEFIRFWTYGPIFELRVATVGQQNDILFKIVEKVLEKQAIWGIKETNALLKKVEDDDYPDDSVKSIYENSLFEKSSQSLSSKFLNESTKTKYLNILVENQIHCLQSNDSETRRLAALTISQLDKGLLNGFNTSQSILLEVVDLFLSKWYSWNKLSLNELTILSNQLNNIQSFFKKDLVVLEIKTLQNNIYSEIKTRRELVRQKKEQSKKLYIEFKEIVNEIRQSSLKLDFNDSKINKPPESPVNDATVANALSQWSVDLVDFLKKINDCLLLETQKTQLEINLIASRKNEYFNQIVNNSFDKGVWFATCLVGMHIIGGNIFWLFSRHFWGSFQLSIFIAFLVFIFRISANSNHNDRVNRQIENLKQQEQKNQKLLSSLEQNKQKFDNLIDSLNALK